MIFRIETDPTLISFVPLPETIRRKTGGISRFDRGFVPICDRFPMLRADLESGAERGARPRAK